MTTAILNSRKTILASAYKGGASKGLAYLQWFKEAEEKDIKETNIIGASAGAIFGALRACGFKVFEMIKFLKDIEGDKLMKWSADIEKKKKGWLFKFLIILPGMRWFIFNSMKKILKNLTWEKVKKNNCNLTVCAVFNEHIISFLGKDIFEKDGKILNIDKLENENCEKIYKKIPCVYFTNKGVYCDVPSNAVSNESFKSIKISNTIVPLYKAILCSFWNPFLKFFKLHIKISKKIKKKFNLKNIFNRYSFFDGGLINNYAGSIFFKNIPYVQFSCDSLPSHDIGLKGLKKCSDYIYNLHRGEKEYVLNYDGDEGFFSYYDSNVEKMSKKPSTNFFSEW